MEIEFDPDKDEANRKKHELSLAEAERMEFDGAVSVPDTRHDYGEDRFRAYGFIGEQLHVLVYTVRGTTLRAISLRKANPREVRRYGEWA